MVKQFLTKENSLSNG